MCVELVGAFDPGGPLAGLSALAGVHLTGVVDDLKPVYERAHLVVAPLRDGGGTRIKILEAFAAGVPVVSTAAGVAGLPVEHGRHALLAESATDIARAVTLLAGDEALACSLAAEARRLVAEGFTLEIVGRTLRSLMRQLERAGPSR